MARRPPLGVSLRVPYCAAICTAQAWADAAIAELRLTGADPPTAATRATATLREGGVTRLSLGMQSG